MSSALGNAATDTSIYCKARTFAEHCAWLDSLTDTERLAVHIPPGHLFNLALVSWWKRTLFNTEMTAGERLKFLDSIASAIFGPVTAEAVAAIEPACDDGAEMLSEICSLPVDRQTITFSDGDVFRLLAKLNPSLHRALELCGH